MKSVLVFLFMVGLSSSAFAQLNVNVQAIATEEVPAAVQTAQTGYFPGLTVSKWEKQTASGPNNSGTQYVASFQDASHQVVRARYGASGQGTTATTYYASGTQLPAIIQSAAQNYPGYTLKSGEKLQLLANERIIFRIRLRSGAKKLVAYVNSNGEEISRSNLPREVRAEENVN